jgi:uncharacterized protein YbaA (DUF1428 family)
MRYVDGYVLPVPKKNLAAYRRMAEKAGTIWREHGVLEYRECAGDHLDAGVIAQTSLCSRSSQLFQPK